MLVFPNVSAATEEVPANAQASTYGPGWECDAGFRETDGACNAIVLPANAYPTNRSYGPGWECNRGYTEAGNACEKIEIPENAYLTP